MTHFELLGIRRRHFPSGNIFREWDTRYVLEGMRIKQNSYDSSSIFSTWCLLSKSEIKFEDFRNLVEFYEVSENEI